MLRRQRSCAYPFITHSLTRGFVFSLDSRRAEISIFLVSPRHRRIFSRSVDPRRSSLESRDLSTLTLTRCVSLARESVCVKRVSSLSRVCRETISRIVDTRHRRLDFGHTHRLRATTDITLHTHTIDTSHPTHAGTATQAHMLRTYRFSAASAPVDHSTCHRNTTGRRPLLLEAGPPG